MLQFGARLKMRHQLALIVVALLVPLAFIGTQYAIGLNESIHERALADSGLRYVHELNEAGPALAAHAAFTSAVLAGDTNSSYFGPRIRDAAKRVEAAFEAQNAAEAQYGLAGSRERALWEEIKSDWTGLSKGWGKLMPEDSGARHDALSEKLTQLVRLIAESHHLDRDSDLGQAYLQSAAVLGVPRIAVEAGRVRAAAAPVAAQMMAVTQEQEAQVNGELANLHGLVNDAEWKLNLSTRLPGGAADAKVSAEAAALASVKSQLLEYERWLRGNVLTRRPVAIPTEEIMENGAKLDTELSALHALLTRTVEARSAERLAAGQRERRIAFGVVAAMVFAALLLAVVSTRRIARSVATAVDAFGAIERGHYDYAIPTGADDEIGHLLRSLAVMQGSLKTRVETDRAALEEGLRVRQALDSAGSVVLVADENQRIVFANQAAKTTFATLAADIRRDLPAFKGEQLVGGSLEMFRGLPALATDTLRALTAPQSSIVVLGGHTLVLGVSPVADAGGRRLGTVLEWRNRSVEVSVENEVKQVVASALDGALDRRLDPRGKTEFHATLATGLNSMISNTSEVLRTIRESAHQISEGVQDMMRGNEALSTRTEQQASSLEETASAMEEMTATVRQNADAAAQADELAIAAKNRAESGRAIVSDAVTAMGEIRRASEKIRDIIGVIDEIAFQTNLLALNAAVEAARAGEQGRGFAVVASEVRNLAGRSAQAAKEIKALIGDSVGKVVDGARLVENSGQSLEEIVRAVEAVTERVGQIANASREQSAGIDEVNRAITSMDQMTQQNASLVQEDARRAQRLEELVVALSGMVAKYRLDEGSARQAPVARPTAPRAAAG